MTILRLLCTPLLCLPLLGACDEGGDAAKGEESTVPAQDPKSDNFRSPTDHGGLDHGVEVRATFADGRLFHVWTFTLTGEARLTLTTTSVDPKADTVMYLYTRDNADETWGSYIARNDDYDGLIASQLSGSYGAGQYRVLVKGYNENVRGTFALVSACDGAGCASGGGDFLTAEQEQLIVDGFDSICGDTFCAGDLNFYMDEAHCDGSTGTCVLTLDGRAYYEEDWITADAFDGVDLDQYTERGALGADGRYVGTILGAVDKGADGVWVRGACALTNGYHALEDVLEAKYGGRLDITDKIYDDFLECHYAIESYFWGP